MTPERYRPKRPYEIFGMTEEEVARWRVPDEKLKEILANPDTTINTIKVSSNNYGEFLFLTASRGKGEKRVCMSFYGLGYHEYRERWISTEWFWRQTPTRFVPVRQPIAQEEALALFSDRLTEISPHLDEDTQTELGRMFEALADMTDDDAALAEMQDLGLL